MYVREQEKACEYFEVQQSVGPPVELLGCRDGLRNKVVKRYLQLSQKLCAETGGGQ